MESGWESLQRIPSLNWWIFPVVYHKKNNVLFSVNQNYGLLKYSFLKNKWNEYNTSKLPASFIDTDSIRSLAIDSENNKIYICNKDKSIATLSLSADKECKSKWNIMSNVSENRLCGAKGIVINGQYHVIGGSGNDSHLVFNPETNKFDIYFDDFPVFPIVNVVRIKNKLLILENTSLQEYDAINETWGDELSVALPNLGDHGFESTVVYKEKYVLLFGRGEARDIWIYSVQDQKFTKSTVKCPSAKKPYNYNKYVHQQTFAVHNKQNDELAMFGFVRREWKLSGIEVDYIFPPYYLLKVMQTFYWNECVHLFNAWNGKHWRVDIFDILD